MLLNRTLGMLLNRTLGRRPRSLVAYDGRYAYIRPLGARGQATCRACPRQAYAPGPYRSTVTVFVSMLIWKFA